MSDRKRIGPQRPEREVVEAVQQATLDATIVDGEVCLLIESAGEVQGLTCTLSPAKARILANKLLSAAIWKEANGKG